MAIYDRNTKFNGMASIPRPGSWVPQEHHVPSIGLTQEEQWLADRERSKKPYLTPRSSPAHCRAPIAEPHESIAPDTTDIGDDE